MFVCVGPIFSSLPLMSGACHIGSVLIGVKYRNWCPTLNVYLLFDILLRQIYQKLNYSSVHKLQLGKSVSKVNKHPNFNTNFDTHCQLEHFEYDMNRTLEVEVGPVEVFY